MSQGQFLWYPTLYSYATDGFPSPDSGYLQIVESLIERVWMIDHPSFSRNRLLMCRTREHLRSITEVG